MAEELTITEQEQAQILALNYLSNLFTKFNFENKETSGKNPQAYTDQHFDTLKLIGDEWIKFAGVILQKAEGKGQDIMNPRAIKIQHSKLNVAESEIPDYIDTAGHITNPDNLKLYITDSDGNGNIVFSYSPPSS